MLLVCVVALSMAAKDALGAAWAVFLNDGHPYRAGICDTLGDVAAVICYGLPGAELLLHGVTGETVLVVMGMAAGSMVGTVAGSKLSRRVDATPNTATP